MPLYQYQHPDHPIVIDIVQSMKEPHVYIDDEGTEWKRVWSVPNASIDTQIDDFSSNQFVDKTRGKGMTMGQLWDESNAASERRAKIGGKDPVREKYFKKYSKERQGLKHQNDPSSKKDRPIQI